MTEILDRVRRMTCRTREAASAWEILLRATALPMASPSDLEGRVLAILDPRRNHRGLKRKTCYALMLLAVLLVIPCAILRLGYAQDKKSQEPVTTSSKESDKKATTGDINVPPTGGQRFELTILGADKRPVPRCSVEVRSDVLPGRTGVVQGTFTKQSRFAAFLKTDAKGSLILNFPRKPKRLDVYIDQPGYGPYWAQWRCEERSEVIPARFIAELDAAWSVGGIIVDSQGKPIQGAMISPSIKFKKRPGDTQELWSGDEVTTDAEGKWRFDSIPVSMNDVPVSINHPKFKPTRLPLIRSEFGIGIGGPPVAKIELQRGITVLGKVSDDTGKPIAEALIRTKFLNDIREAKTNVDGDYQLGGCEPAMARIVVSAKGRATEMKEVRCAADMDPVNFAMKPGGKIRVRVLDENGNPAAKASIFFQQWGRGRFQYFEFKHAPQYADKNGVWQWDEAPLDEIQADICPPHGMQLPEQRLVARNEEYVFRTHPMLVVSGSVIDAETRRPVKLFRAVPGIRSIDPCDPSGKSHIDWERNESYAAKDARYRVQFDREYLAHLVRIEANGYRVAVSRDIKGNEGKVQIDFALVRAKDIAATLLTPDGRPAARAKIAIGIVGSQINVDNGEINDGSTYAARCEADAAGRFRFPAQEGPYQLVITHPAGFAYLKSADGEMPGTIALTAWARVEGTFRVAAKPVANVAIEIDNGPIDSYGQDVPHIFSSHHARTGPDGKFVFERVLPGEGRIRRGIVLIVDNGATEVASSTSIHATFPAGKTTHIDLGGSGRLVTGKLSGATGSKGKVLWQFASIDVQADLPEPKPPPVPAEIDKNPQLRSVWLKTSPEARTWQELKQFYEKLRRASPSFFATVAGDGSFHIDDMPAGSYVLRVYFVEHSAGRLSNYRFTVPPIDGNRSSEPLDLGELTLERN